MYVSLDIAELGLQGVVHITPSFKRSGHVLNDLDEIT